LEQDKKEYVKYENDIKEEKERCEQDIEEYNKLTKKYKDNMKTFENEDEKRIELDIEIVSLKSYLQSLEMIGQLQPGKSIKELDQQINDLENDIRNSEQKELDQKKRLDVIKKDLQKFVQNGCTKEANLKRKKRLKKLVFETEKRVEHANKIKSKRDEMVSELEAAMDDDED
jgi:hypothetical protein